MINKINKKITQCDECPRLRKYCTQISKTKKKAYQNETYWGKPVAGFGDTNAKILIIGLAPAAHGANRTGRMFTGDRSGEWLYRALFKAGLAKNSNYYSINDGQELYNTYITAIVKCAPPENKPTKEEIKNCSKFLEQEIDFFLNNQKNKNSHKVIITLGQLAYNEAFKILKSKFNLKIKKIKFSHALVLKISEKITVIASYHPSQQNTFTGVLTEPEFQKIFTLALNALS
jgi:uracil-DNA glycosylase family 4